MKTLLLVLMSCVVVFGAQSNVKPFNTVVLLDDSLRLDSLNSAWTKAVWIDNNACTQIIFEARDDSSAGFSSDSAAAKIELFQVSPISKKIGSSTYPYFVALKSHAKPDSTTVRGGSKSYVLYDSLDIKAMDSAAVYARNSSEETNNGQRYLTYGDSLKTLQTSGFGAFEYCSPTVDYSACYALKLTGLLSNKRNGVGSIWRIRVLGMRGTKVSQ